MSGTQASPNPNPASTTESSISLLDKAISATRQTEPDDARKLIENFVEQANAKTVSFDRNLSRSVNKAIGLLDQEISKQLNAIMHDPRFLKLEGSWRGLQHLVKNSETGVNLKLKVLNASKQELGRNFERAVEFDQSALFRGIYENEFGQAGGEPYGALIGDYEWTHHPEDIQTLRGISQVSAAAFAPFVSAVGAGMFGFDSWTKLPAVREVETTFDTLPYAGWRSFRNSDESRFVSLVMPRVLARLPYGKATKRVDGFDYEEAPLDRDGTARSMDHDDYCWMNAAYAMGVRMTAAFSETGFCTSIRGAENGGKVDNLPLHVFTSLDGDDDGKCPTEVLIPERRDAELAKCGFMPLVHYKNTDYSVFFSGQTVNKPVKYDTPAATENAAISARLPYIMATSRFAHYLKVMARDKIGSAMEAEGCERWLNRWISNYVNGNENAGPELKARCPLREAQVTVTPIPGSPGAYNAVAHLRPWLQFEELTTSMRLVTEIPARN